MYSWIDHTSQLELQVEAGTDTEVLEEATRALAERLRRDRDEPGGELVSREVAVQADDGAQLLAAWLEELVLLAEVEGLIAERVQYETLDQRGVRARIEGRRGDPPHLVKAVTYQRLAFEPTDTGWRATVVLDIWPAAGGPTTAERGS
jgi:SHS2 domain-containing protein